MPYCAAVCSTSSSAGHKMATIGSIYDSSSYSSESSRSTQRKLFGNSSGRIDPATGNVARRPCRRKPITCLRNEIHKIILHKSQKVTDSLNQTPGYDLSPGVANITRRSDCYSTPAAVSAERNPAASSNGQPAHPRCFAASTFSVLSSVKNTSFGLTPTSSTAYAKISGSGFTEPI